METTDRYKALGVPYPDPETMCKGQCEGLGVVPVHIMLPIMTQERMSEIADGVHPEDETDPELRRLWHQAEAKESAADGWHFVACQDCGGTGKEINQ
jgi:hypothetical protein